MAYKFNILEYKIKVYLFINFPIYFLLCFLPKVQLFPRFVGERDGDDKVSDAMLQFLQQLIMTHGGNLRRPSTPTSGRDKSDNVGVLLPPRLQLLTQLYLGEPDTHISLSREHCPEFQTSSNCIYKVDVN